MNFLLVPFEFLCILVLRHILPIVFKIAIKAAVCLPQLVTSIIITERFLPPGRSTSTCLYYMIAVTLLLYGATIILKNISGGLRQSGSWLWLPLFTILVAYTCLLPGIMAYRFIEHTMQHADPAHAKNLAAVAGFAFAIFLFFRNRLLGHEVDV